MYLDRNNTPDIWDEIMNLASEVQAHTLLLKPNMLENASHVPDLPGNMLTARFFYECAVRLLHRADHECLNKSEPEKAIEVLLKFTKLYERGGD